MYLLKRWWKVVFHLILFENQRSKDICFYKYSVLHVVYTRFRCQANGYKVFIYFLPFSRVHLFQYCSASWAYWVFSHPLTTRIPTLLFPMPTCTGSSLDAIFFLTYFSCLYIAWLLWSKTSHLHKTVWSISVPLFHYPQVPVI